MSSRRRPDHHRPRTPRRDRRRRRRRRRPGYRCPTARHRHPGAARRDLQPLAEPQPPGQLVADLSTGTNAQAKTVAEIIQRADPDVVLLNEFDYVEGDVAADLFRANYLEVPQGGADPVDYPYAFVAPSNTGIASGFDLNNNGATVTTPLAPGYGDDAYGFGAFEGQFGMAVLSKHPIATDDVRTFQHSSGGTCPARCSPTTRTRPRPPTGTPRRSSTCSACRASRTGTSPWTSAAGPCTCSPRTRLRRPSTAPRTATAGATTTRSASGPTTSGRGRGLYIYDDAGGTGGLTPGASFVILGDQNADPLDGDSVAAAIDQLLDHPRITDPLPTSAGAVEASALQGGANMTHRGDPAHDTADFNDNPAPGNLRADYVLPSRDLRPLDAAVFWPVQADPLSALTGTFPFPSSDHRLVWVDLRVHG